MVFLSFYSLLLYTVVQERRSASFDRLAGDFCALGSGVRIIVKTREESPNQAEQTELLSRTTLCPESHRKTHTRVRSISSELRANRRKAEKFVNTWQNFPQVSAGHSNIALLQLK